MLMEIRFLTPDDADQWLRLRMEALEGDLEAFSASLDEYRSLSLDEVKRRLWSDGDAFVLGAFEEGCLRGIAGFYREKGPKSRHKGRVWGVYVTPGARGARIGYKMMQALLDRAMRIEGLEQVLLSVAATQEPAIRLYRSVGFNSLGREPRALRIGDRYIDEEYMVLPVRRWDI
jgi:ribosomal protein S18 acetylase RimI-like enzyme